MRVAITRPAESAGALLEALHRAGAEVLAVPAIRRRPPRSFRNLDRGIGKLRRGAFRAVAFTSAASAESFVTRLLELGGDARDLHGRTLGAVGKATAAALAQRGLRADLVPGSGGAAALARLLLKKLGPGDEVLLPRAAEGREELPEALRAAGVEVTVAEAYRTLPVPPGQLQVLVRELEAGRIDALVLASPSAVTAVARAAGPLLGRTAPVAIGQTTADALLRRGVPAAVVARAPTDDAIVAALRGLASSRPGLHPRTIAGR